MFVERFSSRCESIFGNMKDTIPPAMMTIPASKYPSIQCTFHRAILDDSAGISRIHNVVVRKPLTFPTLSRANPHGHDTLLKQVASLGH
jgi:hypothetical protein